MANSRIVFPTAYIPDPDKGRPLWNAKIYIGQPDLDPRIAANRLTVTGIQENGTEVTLSQPIRTNSGGVPIDSISTGNVVTLLVDGEYSMAIDDRQDNQKYYFANVDSGAPVTFDVLGLYTRYPFKTLQDAKIGILSDGITTVDLEVGDFFVTDGYNSQNDGGGAEYYVDSSTGSDDGGLRIDLDNGLQAQLITNNVLNIKQFGAVGDYDTDDTEALLNALTAYSETNLPVYLPRGVYGINQSIDLPDRLVMYGDGAPIIATFPQTGGDKSLLRPGFKDQISGSSLIFKAVDSSYVTVRSDRYATQTYAMSAQVEGPIQLRDFAIIQDMDVLDSGGTVTTSSNDNKVDIGAGLILQCTESSFNNMTIFGYFDNAGLIIHNPQTGIDPEYNNFSNTIINGGTAIIGNDTAAGTASGGITGMRFVDCGLYGADHQTRADGDYTIPTLYIDGFLTGAQAGIRGHSFTGSNFRTYANNAISTDHVDDFTFTDCVTEFPLLSGVTNADELGGFSGTENTKNFRAHALAATNDLKMGEYLSTITGKFQVTGAGSFDNSLFGEAGSGVRLFASSSSGNSFIQLTDDFTSTATGWTIIRDSLSDDALQLTYEGLNVLSLDKNGGISTGYGFAFGGAKEISSGEITVTNNAYFSIDTEASAATDDLDTINGGSFEGQIIYIRSANTDRTVVVKDTTGNIRLNNSTDFSMDNTQDRMVLMYDGVNWVEISRSNNGV